MGRAEGDGSPLSLSRRCISAPEQKPPGPAPEREQVPVAAPFQEPRAFRIFRGAISGGGGGGGGGGGVR